MNDELFAMTCDIIKKTGMEIVMPRFDRREKTDFFSSTAFEVRNALITALSNVDKSAVFTDKEDVSALYHLTAAINLKKNVWVVNPLDGESDFAKGGHAFAVTIAHMTEGVTDAAWIYLPAADILLCGDNDSGVFINGKKTEISAKKHTEIIDVSDVHAEKAAKEFGIDKAASTALSYFNVISGKTDGAVIDQKLMPWDHAAGIFLHKLAGGYNGYADTSPYRPENHSRNTLVMAVNRIEFKKLCSFAKCWESDRKAADLHIMAQSYAMSPLAKDKDDFEKKFAPKAGKFKNAAKQSLSDSGENL